MGMKPQTTDDVFDLMDSYVTAAALGTAMELGLFWLLDQRPRAGEEIATELQIPSRRCNYWLRVIESTGLIEAVKEGYRVSRVGRTAILEACSQNTWFYMARQGRDQFPAVVNLTNQIREPTSTWEEQDYVAQMMASPERAEQFTRMLYEIHQSLAEEIAKALDLESVTKVLDLGGGSGVVSTALLRRNPDLQSTILDIPNVCAVGRQIARENGVEDRITYLETDLLKDDLPAGFDLIMQCDVGLDDEAYLRKILSALEPGGRLVIVDQFESAEGVVSRQWMYWAFLASMGNPDFEFGTTAELTASMREVGFKILSEQTLPGRKHLTWDYDWVLIDARKE
jgi:ubiquinone/menaquinone biosynthesis C-methylase UbiE